MSPVHRLGPRCQCGRPVPPGSEGLGVCRLCEELARCHGRLGALAPWCPPSVEELALAELRRDLDAWGTAA